MEGTNSTSDDRPGAWDRAIDKFWAPVLCMHEVAILFELMLGDYLEAGIIAILLIFNRDDRL